MFYPCLPLTAVTETGEPCTFFAHVPLQLIPCNIFIIFMWSYLNFVNVVVKFVSGLVTSRLQPSPSWTQTHQTSKQNQQYQPRDSERERTEVHLIKHYSVLKNIPRCHPLYLLSPICPPEVCVGSGFCNPLTALTGMMVWRVFLTKLHAISIVVLHMLKLLSVHRKISEQSWECYPSYCDS